MLNKEYHKNYYQEHKEECLFRVRLRQTNLHYLHEKTEKQRWLRNIKRKTRYHFPLKDKKCEFCPLAATEHHHNTTPIEFDKFNYVCHACHVLLHVNNCKGVLNNG